MGENKLRFIYLYLLFAVLWGFSFFVSVVSPPFLSYYTFDETFIADSGVFLWYGITPRILDWPASPSVLSYGLIFGVSVLYHLLAGFSSLNGFLDAFIVMDIVAYGYLFDREPFILAGRALQLVVVMAGMLWTLRFLFRQQHPLLNGHSRLLIALILISTHLIWNSGAVLRPEALSATFFIHILCRLLFSQRLERNEVLLLSVLFGLVAAERLIFLFMAPLFFAGIFILSKPDGLARIKFSFGMFLLAFVAFCPFVLTDPLIISKAFFGGILSKVNDSPMGSLFNWQFISSYFNNPAGYLAVILTGLGLYRIWREKNPFYFIVAGNWLFFLFLVLRSSKIYDPHVLPAALINLFIMGIGLGTLSGILGRKQRYIPWIIALLIAASEIVVMVNYHFWVRRDTNEHEAIRWIRKELPNDAKLLVGIDMGLHLPPNDQALERQIAATDNVQNKLNKLSYLMGLNAVSTTQISRESMPLSASAFAFEDEALFGLQYRLLRKYGKAEKEKRFDVDIFVEDNTLFYHGILKPEAMTRLEEGRYDYFISDEEWEGESPLEEFSAHKGGAVRIYKVRGRKSDGT